MILSTVFSHLDDFLYSIGGFFGGIGATVVTYRVRGFRIVAQKIEHGQKNH